MRIFLSILIIVLSPVLASANCLENEEIPIIKKLKSQFLVGDYDLFFRDSGADKLASEEVIHRTKVLIIQEFGVAETCVDMMSNKFSQNFETKLVSFVNDKKEMIFLHFSTLLVDEAHQLIGVQISTDFSEIFEYVR